MLGSLSDGVIATDAEGYVQYVNPAAQVLTGWINEEAKGRVIEQVYPLTQRDGTPLEHCQLRQALLSKAPVGKKRFCMHQKDGCTVLVDDSATPIMDQDRVLGAVTIFHDISQQEKTEHVLRQTEKLAIVGRLASSISHEINNPLAAITNLLYIAEQELPPESSVLGLIQQANAELARITHITTETLRFHRQSTHATEVDLTSVVDSVLTLHQGRVRSLQVSVERVCNATCWRTARRGVRITVADTGIGMSAATLKKLFTPFFTTKAATGTGLGLWISAGLIEKHSGQVRLRSSQRQKCHGTVFTVFLPAPLLANPLAPTAIAPRS